MNHKFRTAAPSFGLLIVTVASVIPYGAVGQDQREPQTDLPALVEQLERVQQLNLEIAHRIAAIQVSSAETIRKAAAEGTFAGQSLEAEATAIADNIAILAVVALAPIGTRAEATGEAFLELLRQNVSQLDALMVGTMDEAAHVVLRKVRDGQIETEELYAGLDGSWTQYEHALRLAELGGTLPIGTFDPRRRKWEFPTSAAVPKGIPSLPPLPQEGASAAFVPAPSAGEAGSNDVISATGDAWIVTTDRNGLAAATADNLNEQSRGRLSSITIGCNSDGTLKYQVEGDEAFREIAIVFGDTERAFVAVEGGTIVGGQALRMSDSLRLAHEWAEAEQSPTMAIGSSRDPSLFAAVPVANYYEARGAVLANCAPYEAESEPVAAPDSSASVTAPIPFPRPRDRMPPG